jgi:flagellar protein FliL
MSDEATEATAPVKKKGGKMKKLMLFLIVTIVIGGGGVGAGLWATQEGYFGQKAHAKEAEDPNRPKLVVREGVDAPDTLPRGRKPDPRLYQPSYYPIEETFTSNLRDSSEMIQISVGVSTYYDEKMLAALELHEMALRSSILLTLSNQDALQISTPGGKQVLKKDLKRAINDVLEAKEGFGGVDDVYFTSFVIQ